MTSRMIWLPFLQVFVTTEEAPDKNSFSVAEHISMLRPFNYPPPDSSLSNSVFLSTAAREILSKCKSDHVAPLLKTLPRSYCDLQNPRRCRNWPTADNDLISWSCSPCLFYPRHTTLHAALGTYHAYSCLRAFATAAPATWNALP